MESRKREILNELKKEAPLLARLKEQSEDHAAAGVDAQQHDVLRNRILAATVQAEVAEKSPGLKAFKPTGRTLRRRLLPYLAAAAVLATVLWLTIPMLVQTDPAALPANQSSFEVLAANLDDSDWDALLEEAFTGSYATDPNESDFISTLDLTEEDLYYELGNYMESENILNQFDQLDLDGLDDEALQSLLYL